ncbi:MAG: SUMF1/EgtB/PvdO family nonheme iron enzyme [Candidatus Eremiobacteraeota bacterium]|nr:SUMF1/EgtB/PvdO family nonheme iron enzyme [Candidatus Eremiobacteraeota bacterium]
MLTSARPIALDRSALRRWYLANRARTAEIMNIFEPEAYYQRPIALRHPFVFYEGHIPAFSCNTLIRAALGGPSIDPEFELLFERGIDPESVDEAKRHDRGEWPDRSRVRAFGAMVDSAVLRAIDHAVLTDGNASPLLERGQAAFNILEHEEMHHETFLYMLHRLAIERKRPPRAVDAVSQSEPAARGRVAIPAGPATLGAVRDAIPFGWDNEFDQHVVEVAAFEVDVNNTTNGDWLEFVRNGGPIPSFWLERNGEHRLLGMFEEYPLPLSWPVYVTQAQAAAYAAWRGGRVMTEPEYHRAAFGTPDGSERPFPWGSATPDAAVHGNFNLRRFEPESVGVSPLGASAFGVHDLVGNGWEWTSTVFAPFAGFEPMASYPRYSADFFDGQHYLVKGASPVTSRNLVRRSLRNWYRPEYPYVYATTRVLYD